MLVDLTREPGQLCEGEAHFIPPSPQPPAAALPNGSSANGHTPAHAHAQVHGDVQACEGNGKLEVLHRSAELCHGEPAALRECTCAPKYRPAYELADGSLERAGRASGVAPPGPA